MAVPSSDDSARLAKNSSVSGVLPGLEPFWPRGGLLRKLPCPLLSNPWFRAASNLAGQGQYGPFIYENNKIEREESCHARKPLGMEAGCARAALMGRCRDRVRARVAWIR